MYAHMKIYIYVYVCDYVYRHVYIYIYPYTCAGLVSALTPIAPGHKVRKKHTHIPDRTIHA